MFNVVHVSMSDFLNVFGRISWNLLSLFKKWANPGLFLRLFTVFFKQILHFQQINVKNVHPVYGGIHTHDLSNMSRQP